MYTWGSAGEGRGKEKIMRSKAFEVNFLYTCEDNTMNPTKHYLKKEGRRRER
jgi:hypothetical protein